MSATIEDVAQLAGVSAATVSRALRGLPHVAASTRQRVQRAAELLDYVVDPSARSLVLGRTNTLGVVVPTIGRWAHARMLEVVTDVAADVDMDVLPLVTTTAAARRLAEPNHPFRRRVDGFVLLEADLDEVSIIRLRQGRPLVAVGEQVEDAASVHSDEAGGVRAAVAHLVKLGHERIGLFTSASSAADPTRRDAWTDAVAAAGLEPVDHDVVSSQATATGGAAAMVLALESGDPPTAVITASDEMALGALEVARARGLVVPGDLSIVGTDDQPLAQYIGLTTIRRDVTAMATLATRWLVEAVTTTDDDTQVQVRSRRRTFDSALSVRSTTGPTNS